MARPLRAVPTRRKELWFPVHLIERLDILLFDPITGRVPYNAYAKLITPALERTLERSTLDQRAVSAELDEDALANAAKLLREEGYPLLAERVQWIAQNMKGE